MDSRIIILPVMVLYFIIVYVIINRWVNKSGKKWVSNVSYIRLIHEVILFASTNDPQTKIKRLPAVTISYHPHKKWGGSYKNDLITIYKKNIKDVNGLVSVVLHEWAHHTQFMSDVRKFDRKYSEHHNLVGYDCNPFEVEARKFAIEWTKPCLNHLVEMGIIEKLL